MTSLLAGTIAHGARGGRGVSTSHCRSISLGLSGTPWYSPELPGSDSHNMVLSSTQNTCLILVRKNICCGYKKEPSH